jgi:hypothetical protein
MELAAELKLRSLLKEIVNKLDEAETLVSAMLITSDYNADDIVFVENMVRSVIGKLEEARALAEKLNIDDDEWEEYAEVG